MTRHEIVAALVAATLSCVISFALRGGDDSTRSRAARAALWLALASPVPFLLVPPLSRPCIYVSGPRGVFEATRLFALAAAASSLVLTALEGIAGRMTPRSIWGAGACVLLASLVGLVAATALVL